jgi:hypothetical protein
MWLSLGHRSVIIKTNMLRDRVHQEQEHGKAAAAVDGAIREAPPYTPELVHGHYETVALTSGEYVKMSQVRGEINPSNDDLKASILRTGLINPIDVAHLSEASLVEYISFVNQIWGAKSLIKDFTPQQQSEGSYYLIIAGHSRHQAIEELEQEGRSGTYRIEAKVHGVTSPDDIIQIQLDENIHTQPPRERRAVALVEAYKWGVVSGKWSTQKEFLSTRGDIGRSALYEALAFENLPPVVRNFVLSGKMSYTAGIELGKSAQDLRDYICYKANIDAGKETLEQTALIDERHLIKLVIETNTIINKKMNSTAAQKRIRSWRTNMQREMTDSRDGKNKKDTSLFEYDLYTPQQILDQDLHEDRKELAEFIRRYSRFPGTFAMDMIALNKDVVPQEVVDQALLDFKISVQNGARLVGHPAVVRTYLSEE